MNVDDRARAAVERLHRTFATIDVPHPSVFRRRWRRRRAMQAAASGVAALALVGVVGTQVLTRNGGTEPSVRSAAPDNPMPGTSAPGNRYTPPTRTDGASIVMPLTLVDGSRFELRYPASLGLAELGVVPVGIIEWPLRGDPLRCCGATLNIRYTSIAETFGDAAPLMTFEGADDDGVVQLYDGAAAGRTVPQDYLVYEFGPWMVERSVPEKPGDYMDVLSTEELSTWARSLSGRVDKAGYLVLDARSPLAHAPDAAWVVMGGPSSPTEPAVGLPVLEFFTGTGLCEPGATKEGTIDRSESDGEGSARWCIQGTNILVGVSGPKDFVDLAVGSLDIRPMV